MGTTPSRPSNEANAAQLELARAQGRVLEHALDEMIDEEARGAERRAGDYLVGWATEHAEGVYVMDGDDLRWEEPQDENCHLEISVRDATDGRFIPQLRVQATLVDAEGIAVGTHDQPFLWHPWLHHYGRNWRVPGPGTYRLRVQIEPPTFPRHDRVNGFRYRDVVTVEFDAVRIEPGQKQSEPPASLGGR